MSRRILLLRSNPVAPDPRVEKIARALVATGYTVQALGWDRTATLPLVSEEQSFTIRRLPIKAEYGRGLGNLPQLMRWQWGLWRWLMRHHADFDILHACDFDTILPALWCRWRYHKPVIYDIFDFYADHLRSTPAWLKKLIRKVDLWAIGKADATILVDDTRRQQIAGAHPRRLTIIYNSPEDLAPVLPAGSSAGELRIAYIGLLQVERGLFEMLTVLERHPEWTLDLAGYGGDESRMLAQVSRMPNIRWHGRVSYDQSLALSQAADVLFATYDPAVPNHRYSSPNKLFEAMLLGKPLIAARNTNIDRIVLEEDCGLVVDYGDVAQLEAALQSLAGDPGLRTRLGTNARRAYDEKYSWEQMRKRLVNLYAEVLADRQKAD